MKIVKNLSFYSKLKCVWSPLQVKLTAEQARIANHRLSSTDELVKIVAFAGTGKTTTLIEMCQNNPDLEFLVVVYNKDVQLRAKNAFPKNNTVVQTAHALAMKKVGCRYRDRVIKDQNGKIIKSKLNLGSLKPQGLISSGMVDR